MVLTRSSHSCRRVRGRTSRRRVRATTLIALMAGLATAIPLHPAVASTGVRALFPPAGAYPRHTHLQPAITDTHLDALVDPATARQVARYGFVTGGVQVAALPAGGSVTVTILAVRTPHNAATFLRVYHPSALAHPATSGVAVAGLGAGTRYVTGQCATCTQPTPLGILLVRRGTAVVEIDVQPPNRVLIMRLGHAIASR